MRRLTGSPDASEHRVPPLAVVVTVPSHLNSTTVEPVFGSTCQLFVNTSRPVPTQRPAVHVC